MGPKQERGPAMDRPDSRRRWLWPAFVFLAGVTAAFGVPSSAQEVTEGPEARKPEATDEAQSSREVMRAIQQLRAAVQAERAEGRKLTATDLPRRPERKVVAPTLTSADLDRMIADCLKETDPKVAPAPLTSDIEFVRRVYFDLAGVPPTPGQLAEFVSSRDRDRRAKLIDTLLQSPEYARNWARYWRDVIRFHATNENIIQVRYDLLESWLAERFEKNTPWDEVARDLITATGRVDENGAVSFALAHEAKPVELAGEVSRIFLGVQIQCAQCHDHKTDSWKREQFHEFAAFFSGVRSRAVMRGMPGQLPVFEAAVQGRARYAMPDLKDPKTQIPVAPAFFLTPSGERSRLPENLDTARRRSLGASYVTGQDNPWFARAFVNRMWYVLMGESFYDAVDDLGPERTPRAREVVETLADQWQKGGHDIRWLLRTIANTRAYQRRVRSTANPAGKTAFAASCPSRLRSDQIAEALIAALGLPADLLATPTGAKAPRARKAVEASGLAGAPAAAKGQGKAVRLGGPRLLLNALFGVDPSAPVDEVLGTIPQALFLMNGPMVHNRTQVRPGTPLGQILAAAPDDRAALRAIYLRVLSREPTEQEVETCSAYLAKVGNRKEAFEDIYWALLNSTEFLSRR
ncbi:MAG: DUF1549 domain-containing protein [Isosphaeraceae bacterium]